MIGALAAMGLGSEAGAAAMLASGAEQVEASPHGAFALDQACLKKCGSLDTGAPGMACRTSLPTRDPASVGQA